jgi:ZIP family zinc transporter
MTATLLIAWTFGTGLISALATGLGAIPVHFISNDSKQIRAMASAIAAGMMISASVFSLIDEGIQLRTTIPMAPYIVIIGLIIGAYFFYFTEKILGDAQQHAHHFRSGVKRSTILVFLAMLIHSFPEGIAIGVGYATEDITFGSIMATAISVHNIPEGIAIALALKKDGYSTANCALMAILSSLPQPVMAVPSALLAWLFIYLLPVGLGFAGGAMLYVVFSELIPEALESSDTKTCTIGVISGLVLMLTLTILLDSWFTLH